MDKRESMKETATLSITMPLNLFLKWDYECRKDFNDVRYVKLMTESQKAKLLDLLLEGDITNKVEELKKIMKGE